MTGTTGDLDRAGAVGSAALVPLGSRNGAALTERERNP
jgi:hypothetical protein